MSNLLDMIVLLLKFIVQF